MECVNLTAAGCISASNRTNWISFLSKVHGLWTNTRSKSSFVLKTTIKRLSSISRIVKPLGEAHRFCIIPLKASPLKERLVSSLNNKLNCASFFDCCILSSLSRRLFFSWSDNQSHLHNTSSSFAVALHSQKQEMKTPTV